MDKLWKRGIMKKAEWTEDREIETDYSHEKLFFQYLSTTSQLNIYFSLTDCWSTDRSIE